MTPLSHPETALSPRERDSSIEKIRPQTIKKQTQKEKWRLFSDLFANCYDKDKAAVKLILQDLRREGQIHHADLKKLKELDRKIQRLRANSARAEVSGSFSELSSFTYTTKDHSLAYLLTTDNIYKLSLDHFIAQGASGSVFGLDSIEAPAKEPMIIKIPRASPHNKTSIIDECKTVALLHERSQKPLIGIMGRSRLVKEIKKNQESEIIGYIAPKYDSGTYFDIIEKNSRKSSLEAKLFQAAQLLKALDTLDELGFSHGDIKPENIFIQKKEGEKILLFLGDFEGALEAAQIGSLKEKKLSQEYALKRDLDAMASLKDQELLVLRKAMDSFAVGTILFLLFSKDLTFPYPFSGHLQKATKREWRTLADRIDAPESITCLIVGLLHPDYRERASTQEAFQQFTQLMHEYPRLEQMIEEEGWSEAFAEKQIERPRETEKKVAAESFKATAKVAQLLESQESIETQESYTPPLLAFIRHFLPHPLF